MMVNLPRRYLQSVLWSSFSLLLILLMVPATASTLTSPAASSSAATGTIDKPVSLSPHLTPITDPFAATANNTPSDFSWYQLDLVLSPDFSTDWFLVFSRIPHLTLDVYLPENGNYQVKRMGLDGLSAANPDARTIRLPLTSGQSHRLLFKVSQQSVQTLNPELWPASLYSLSEYRYHALAASLQTILLVILTAALAVMVVKRTLLYLPLSLHLSAMSLLMVALNGRLFRVIPHSFDPAQLISILTVLTMLSALTCYLNLFRTTRPTPRSTMILSGAILVACGLTFGFIFATGNTIPSLPLVLLLCLQSISLSVLHYLLQPDRKGQPFTINLIKSSDKKRRVFSQHFRDNLADLNLSDNTTELSAPILAIIDATLDQAPAVLLTLENNEWQLSSLSPRVKRQVEKELEYFVTPLTKLLTQGSDDQIHFQDKHSNSIWGFHLNDDGERQLFLLLFPGKYQKETISRQQALDLCSYIKTILKANQQTRFWQLQASLDPLTGLLNRNHFFHEAEKQVEACKQQQTPCCLLFIDVDDFKRINDKLGHPAGDKVLVDIAHLIRDSLRHQDLIARYGGEEFVILLPVTSAWQGAQIAERIRKRVEQYNASPTPATLSLGLATLSSELSSLNQLINEADNAMYTAKKRGKNRLEPGPSCSDIRLSWQEP
ncbi:diguanylate cyclase [Endozoicomonas montiporae]|uniref:diguanylate cyclase n=1 Tax=Endozoicomonas montiporae CL-33 TaxID=570277 RepID=A0A142BBK7_9GAMM|nr:diguanylate cyclase [Endozoicomonas montiporae]AMO56133.1 PAS/PAC sensor-containing diguanylate cyclase [Endozoicomonas montiporae CL-33]